MNRIYMCIDLKSFYASVECIERNLDPLKTNLVVADKSRTDKTVCLAISPSLKAYGLSGRARLYEVYQKVRYVNYERKKNNLNYKFIGKSANDDELKNNKSLELDFIIAPPRMAYYMKYSTDIYNIYLKYLSPDDIYVYSIDEVFCDITDYLKLYRLTSKELTTKIIKDVFETTGITATAGIGTNMYLAKVSMDIVAKHTKPNDFGVRIACLDEITYRKKLWEHKPLTNFWRVGNGYANKLEKYNIYTMGDIARCSLENEDLLYKLFGVNAELLIDHAWGYEPCTIKDVKSYKPLTTSLSSGQVLHCPYDYKKTKIIVSEMMELLSLDLVDKHLVTDQLTLTIGYDIENLSNPSISENYDGEITIDHYGRKIPKHSHGTINLEFKTSSTKILLESIISLYERIVNKKLLVRRINISANKLENENEIISEKIVEQFDLFTDYKKQDKIKSTQREELQKERKIQNVILNLKNKYGKNAILKGMNLQDGATTIDRNKQIGGHHE